jgi:hypothetical protein
VRRLLETRPELEVVADCGDLPTLLDAVREHSSMSWSPISACRPTEAMRVGVAV